MTTHAHPVQLVALAATAVLSSGCLAATTLITVKPDASGTIDQTIVMSPAAVAQFQQLAAMGQASGANKPTELFPEADMKSAATRLGEGVTFVSSQKIKNADGEGIKAVYAFADIRKLRLDQSPTPPSGMPGVMPSRNPGSDLTFRFTGPPSGNPVVSVIFPAPSPGSGRQNTPDAGRGGQMPPEALAMAKQMFKGLRIDIAMQVAGRIVRTNSPYVEGSKVTLLSVNFEQLLNDPSILGDLQKSPSIDAVRSRLAGIKGVKVPPENEVTIEFTR